MNEMLTDIEKQILAKVFEGDFSPFAVLAKQIDGIRVKSRRKRYHTYNAEFSADDKKVTQLIGHEENIKISGTLFYINESDVTLYVSVTIMYGLIKYLLIGGDYHFENDGFTIKEIVWENRNDDPQEEGTIIRNTSERDYKKAISYIPMYK